MALINKTVAVSSIFGGTEAGARMTTPLTPFFEWGIIRHRGYKSNKVHRKDAKVEGTKDVYENKIN